jgi:hypothetical protein
MMIVKMILIIAMMGEILQILSDNDNNYVDYDCNNKMIIIMMMIVMMMAMMLIVRMMMIIIII